VIPALHKQLTKGALIIYMIMSLLFVVSVKLHVHPGDDAGQASHGEAVAITLLGDNFVNAQNEPLNEIQVGLDKFFSNIMKNIVTALILVASLLVIQISCRYCVGVFYETDASIFSLPFAGTPPLRAPPL
jgi:uncharacterized MnhB-related membrane protein